MVGVQLDQALTLALYLPPSLALLVAKVDAGCKKTQTDRQLSALTPSLACCSSQVLQAQMIITCRRRAQ